MSLRITKCKIWGSRSAIKSTERHLELSSTEYNPFFHNSENNSLKNTTFEKSLFKQDKISEAHKRR